MSDFNDFITLVHQTRDKALLEDLLVAVTTPAERVELTRRLDVVGRLLAGEAQHKIAADLGVGVATVTRGSKELAAGRFKVLKAKS